MGSTASQKPVSAAAQRSGRRGSGRRLERWQRWRSEESTLCVHFSLAMLTIPRLAAGRWWAISETVHPSLPMRRRRRDQSRSIAVSTESGSAHLQGVLPLQTSGDGVLGQHSRRRGASTGVWPSSLNVLLCELPSRALPRSKAWLARENPIATASSHNEFRLYDYQDCLTRAWRCGPNREHRWGHSNYAWQECCQKVDSEDPGDSCKVNWHSNLRKRHSL